MAAFGMMTPRGPDDSSGRAGQPLLSVILITPGSFEAIRKSIDHVRAQNVRAEIEVVIVAPSEAELGLDPVALEGFWGWQIVEVGGIDNLGPAEAVGFRRARGPAVVYVEEHSYPAPGWGEALMQAHAGPWAAIGPAIRNANPDTMVSWTTFFLDFGEWVAPGQPGPTMVLPSHQTSYKRDAVLAFGARLDRLMENEWTLHQELLAEGHQLYFESAAQTNHLNVSRFADMLNVQFQNCREFGGNRAALGNWSWRRRALYVGGSPLIPVLRGRRALGQIRRAGLLRRLMPRILPSLIAGLVAAAAGETIGYLAGKGDASRKRITFELERMRHTTDQDRRNVETT
jgi:hypothetical protein